MYHTPLRLVACIADPKFVMSAKTSYLFNIPNIEKYIQQVYNCRDHEYIFNKHFFDSN